VVGDETSSVGVAYEMRLKERYNRGDGVVIGERMSLFLFDEAQENLNLLMKILNGCLIMRDVFKRVLLSMML